MLLKMESRKTFFGLLILLVLATFLMSGCAQQEKTKEPVVKLDENNTSSKQEINIESNTNLSESLVNESVQDLVIENLTSNSINMPDNETLNKTKEEPVKLTLDDIRTKAKYVCPHRYDGISVDSATGIFAKSPETTNIKIWVDGDYRKEEKTKNGEIIETEITHPDASYTRYSSTGKYIKIDYKYYKNKTFSKATNCNSTTMQKESNAVVLDESVKTEMIDGKLAAVHEFSSVWGDDPSTSKYESGSYAKKEWFWVENGLLLREETVQSNDGSTVSTRKTDYKNFVFEQIPKSMFEDPEYGIYVLN